MRVSVRMSWVAPLMLVSTYGSACPAAPVGFNVDSAGNDCVYIVPDAERFSDAQFVNWLGELSRDISGRKKIVRFLEGDYHFGRSIRYEGAGGWLMQIEGGGSLTTRLIFANVHGIDLEGPVALGLVSRVTLSGDGKRGMRNDARYDKVGILARRGANIRLGQDVVVEEFSRVGIQAFMSSTIYAPGTISRNNGSDGFVASYNSTVYARKGQAIGNRGAGFFSEGSASIFAEDSRASGSLVDLTKGQRRGGDGYVARLGGIIQADRAEASDNEDQDYVALDNGLISARQAKAKVAPKVQSRDGGRVSF